ncbi:hypothetical protein ACFW6S_31585 [Streptomyces sp. NPDC058740]|uniref:hypothetical protein n=1 Tax=Streptomyces sp. NPDC058740 TaxID=3346619 RepID=UPI0036B01882
MTVFKTYGTNTHTAKELCDLLADRLAVTFAQRESDYLGIYFLATLADTTHLHVQPNAIPGDDGEDDLYKDEYPDVPVLLLVTTPDTAKPLDDALATVEGLTRLASSRS